MLLSSALSSLGVSQASEFPSNISLDTSLGGPEAQTCVVELSKRTMRNELGLLFNCLLEARPSGIDNLLNIWGIVITWISK